MPVLSFVFLYKLVNRKVKVLLDVHNFGFTLMFKTKNKFIMNFVTKYEKFFARKISDSTIVVSNGMAQELARNWGIPKV